MKYGSEEFPSVGWSARDIEESCSRSMFARARGVGTCGVAGGRRATACSAAAATDSRHSGDGQACAAPLPRHGTPWAFEESRRFQFTYY